MILQDNQTFVTPTLRRFKLQMLIAEINFARFAVHFIRLPPSSDFGATSQRS